MAALFTFIKDWVPSIAVIIGGLWLLFQWLFGEWLRRQKEEPALDGSLSAVIFPLDQRRKVVSIEARWNNRSPLPLFLDLNRCEIQVYGLNQRAGETTGILIPSRDLGEPLFRHKFLLGVCEVDYQLEPNTESVLVNHFILEPGLYAVRMELHSFKVGGKWWKEFILNVPVHLPAAAKAEKAG